MSARDASTEPRLELETPEAVSVTREAAGVASRGAALGIDAILLGFATLGLALVLLIAGVLSSRNPLPVFGVIVAVLAVFVLAYYPATALLFGDSPGKRLLGIRVIDARGMPASAGAHFVRSFALVLEATMPMPMCSIGMLMIALSRDARRAGDLLAGTYVVRDDSAASREREPYAKDTYAGLPLRRYELPIHRVRALTGADLVVLRGYLARRGALRGAAADHLRDALAARFASELEMTGVTDPDAFLKELFLCLRDERTQH